MAWDFELQLAVDAALEAGALLRDLISKEKIVLSETDKDIKLKADRDAEEIILAVCAKSAYPVLAEESGEVGMTEDEDTPFWPA
jgi:fructose-1,6-bisphosphatase/inositol monophosphatase family enzyme